MEKKCLQPKRYYKALKTWFYALNMETFFKNWGKVTKSGLLENDLTVLLKKSLHITDDKDARLLNNAVIEYLQLTKDNILTVIYNNVASSLFLNSNYIEKIKKLDKQINDYQSNINEFENKNPNAKIRNQEILKKIDETLKIKSLVYSQDKYKYRVEFNNSNDE